MKTFNIEADSDNADWLRSISWEPAVGSRKVYATPTDVETDARGVPYVARLAVAGEGVSPAPRLDGREHGDLVSDRLRLQDNPVQWSTRGLPGSNGKGID